MGTMSSLIHSRSCSLTLRQIRTAAPPARNTGQMNDPDVADVERRGDDLRDDQHRDDGDDQADAPAIVDGPGEDVGRLALQGRISHPTRRRPRRSPLTRASRTKPMRTIVTSMPVACESPPQMPARTRASGSRRSGRRRPRGRADPESPGGRAGVRPGPWHGWRRARAARPSGPWRRRPHVAGRTRSWSRLPARKPRFRAVEGRYRSIRRYHDDRAPPPRDHQGHP